ncbi:type VI secretion system tube protein Hcp [Nissabacter sp. SGAir0207]|uniref:type VI secretion system tube protein Hcp n=1 Tax=Nissabacter sp. SGAir0207 TaxID=2126321 RepID=UPI00351A5DA5
MKVQGREESVELNTFHHAVSLPVTEHSGSITGICEYLPIIFNKEIDCSSTYLYRALVTRIRAPSGWASEGCIILGRLTRERMFNSGDRMLRVVR